MARFEIINSPTELSLAAGGSGAGGNPAQGNTGYGVGVISVGTLKDIAKHQAEQAALATDLNRAGLGDDQAFEGKMSHPENLAEI